MGLKSKFVGRLVISDGLKRDFGQLSTLSQEQLNTVAKWMKSTIGKVGGEEERDALGQQLGIEHGTVSQVVDMALFLLRHAARTGDSWVDIFDDFRHLDVATDESVPRLVTFFEDLREVEDEFAHASKRQELLSLGGMILDSISAATDLRMVTETDFDPRSGSAEEYAPAVKDVVPVAIVMIQARSADDETKQQMSIHMDRENLETVITVLQGILKELSVLKEYAEGGDV